MKVLMTGAGGFLGHGIVKQVPARPAVDGRTRLANDARDPAREDHRQRGRPRDVPPRGPGVRRDPHRPHGLQPGQELRDAGDLPST